MEGVGTRTYRTRSMVRRGGFGRAIMGRIWRAFSSQPHRDEAFRQSRDPLCVEPVRDINGLYPHPPEWAVLLCVDNQDNQSQTQTLDRPQPQLPMRPGAAHAPLAAERNDVAVRQQVLPEAPLRGSPELALRQRQGGATGTRPPAPARQLRHAQGCSDPQNRWLAQVTRQQAAAGAPRPSAQGLGRALQEYPEVPQRESGTVRLDRGLQPDLVAAADLLYRHL